MSYAGAAGRLSGLEQSERIEQVRDWLRTGLAAKLRLDAAQFRDATYDTLQVRDEDFTDLSRQATGPGRALVDGHGVLHLLVPLGAPDESRTIGLLLDQYRADTGADPAQTQVDHYRLRLDVQAIDVAAGHAAAVSTVRADNGYTTTRVDTSDGLAAFLAHTQSLSRLEMRGSQVWASGWNWGAEAGTKITPQDISVLQRGYAAAVATTQASKPGFSLDPQPSRQVADLRAVVPDLSQSLVNAVRKNNWAAYSRPKSNEAFAELIMEILVKASPQDLAKTGLPSDRTQLWALYKYLKGNPLYSQARYDGGLAGTEVGMTLFYTDFVAKNWATGTGQGVPVGAIEGFVPDTRAVTPWSECQEGNSAKGESGRLWFGQNDSAFGVGSDAVNIGAQATRLFSRSDGAGGKEVEPSFAFGRSLHWWDQHFQAVADYEPQYQRLDQIMRWSGALDWLAGKSHSGLPAISESAATTNLRFASWYANHKELKEHGEIDFVKPPSATQEAIAAQPSRAFQGCGFQWIEGGVSLADLGKHEQYKAALPSAVRRAGLFEPTSAFDPATGSGTLKQVSVDDANAVTDTLVHTLSRPAAGHAVTQVTGSGRVVSPFGRLKAWRDQKADRSLTVDVQADQSGNTQRLDYQHRELGRLEARVVDGQVTVRWYSGVVDRARTALESVQNQLADQAAKGNTAQLATATPKTADGVLYSYRTPDGQMLYRLGGPKDRWLSITEQKPPAGDDPAFRLGVPSSKDPKNPTRFFYGALLELPTPGRSGGWIDVTAGSDGRAARIDTADQPPAGRPVVRVGTPDGKTSTTIYPLGDHTLARADDPLVGVQGSVEGAALLRDFPIVEKAMQQAAQAKDGLFHVALLKGDAAVLAHSNDVIVAAAGHPWAEQVRRAIAGRPSGEYPAMLEDGGHIFSADSGGMTATGLPRTMDLGEAQRMADRPVYASDHFRSTWHFLAGPLNGSILPPDLKVTVREFRLEHSPQTDDASASASAEVRVEQSMRRWRVDGYRPGARGGPSPTATTTPSSSPNSTAIASAPSGLIVLICTEDDDPDPKCR
jgi:hypothetical protein